jgi:hypothetical protein
MLPKAPAPCNCSTNTEDTAYTIFYRSMKCKPLASKIVIYILSFILSLSQVCYKFKVLPETTTVITTEFIIRFNYILNNLRIITCDSEHF